MELSRDKTIATHFLRQALRLPKILLFPKRQNPQDSEHAKLTTAYWQEICSELLTANASDRWVRHYKRLLDNDGKILSTLIGEHIEALSAGQGRSICIQDDEYPGLLRHIPDPPLAFSALGPSIHPTTTRVSIVGSRRASSESTRLAYDLGRGLANHSIGVVSGGAFGCDIASQRGWIAGCRPGLEGYALTVFANGLGKLYPQGCLDSFRKFLESGITFVSENFWFAPALPADFLFRNRLISGLSQTTVIVESQKKSGAMATARLALDQGRDVCSYRHSPKHYAVHGNTSLIEDGASSFSSANEFLAFL